MAYNQFERELLNPQTGIFTRRMGDAAGVTAEVSQRFAEFRESQLTGANGLSGSGRQALEQFYQGAEQRMWRRAATHELDQTFAHEEALIGAQIEGQVDRATFLYSDPEEVAASAFQIESLAGDLADARGLQGPARQQFIEGQLSAMHSSVATQMASAGNAAGAEAYIRELSANGKIDATDAALLMDKIRPMSIAQQGSALANQAYAGSSGTVGGTPGDPIAGSPIGVFAHRMGISESGGNAGAARVNRDGREFRGTFQVGEARLADMKAAGIVPNDMSLAEFGSAENAALQQRAFAWHIADIDRVIDEEGFLDKGWHRDGLRAVAHLGGIGGMRQFVRSGGKYNPSDELGTSLEAYYTKFSGHNPSGTAQGAALIDEHEDPEVRAAAYAELERLQSLEHKQFNRRQAQAADDLYTRIEQAFLTDENFNLDDYLRQNPGLIDQLGDELSNVRNFYEKRGQIETQPDIYAGLQIMSEARPDDFVREELWRYRTQLSPQDYRAMVDKQARLLGERAEGTGGGIVTITDLRRNIGAVTGGLDTVDRGEVERRMTQFIQSFEAKEGRAPSAIEQYAQAERLTAGLRGETSFVVDVGEVWGIDEGDALEVLQQVDEAGLPALLQREDLEFNVPGPGGTTQRLKVDPETLRTFAFNYERDTGTAPRPSQVLQMVFLIESGMLP